MESGKMTPIAAEDGGDGRLPLLLRGGQLPALPLGASGDAHHLIGNEMLCPGSVVGQV